jgi:hypothetical protein
MALLATTHVASAQGVGKPVSSGVVGEAEKFLNAAMIGPTAASDMSVRPVVSPTAERANAALLLAQEQKPFVDFMPNVSVVVRDWRGSMKIMGERTMLLDDLRPTASNRMAVIRISTTDARLTPFGHVGAGEWRIDTAMFPHLRSYSEVAGQLGAGIELRLPRQLRMAAEAQYTVLYGNMAYTADEVAPRMLAFLVAIDGKF